MEGVTASITWKSKRDGPSLGPMPLANTLLYMCTVNLTFILRAMIQKAVAWAKSRTNTGLALCMVKGKSMWFLVRPLKLQTSMKKRPIVKAT